jgi:hypothetical protein
VKYEIYYFSENSPHKYIFFLYQKRYSNIASMSIYTTSLVLYTEICSQRKGNGMSVLPRRILFTSVVGLVFLFGLGSLILSTRTQMVAVAQNNTVASYASVNGNVTQVTPFSPSGIRGTAGQGTCWTTSLAAPRTNAWRCSAGNTIYDPCFSTPLQSSYVICDANPAKGQTSGLKVMLTQPLPSATLPSSSENQAWLLRLSNGAICSFATGATFLVHGVRVDYGCSDGSVVIGMPQTGNTWIANVSKNASPAANTNPVITAVSVTKAWT